MNEIHVTTNNPRPSRCAEGPSEKFPDGFNLGGIEVDAVITVRGRRFSGTVSLTSQEDIDRLPELPEMWVAPKFLTSLQAGIRDAEWDDMYDMLESSARKTAATLARN